MSSDLREERSMEWEDNSDNFVTALRCPHHIHEFGSLKEKPLVSIVVPTYNQRELVLELVQELSQYDFSSLELIVVDDGSDDGTYPALVENSTSLGIRGHVIRLLENHGRATARNVGILKANGDIVAFTDSDCLPTKDWLNEGKRAIADSSIGIVQGRTLPHPMQPQPFFNHFIEIEQFDGSFATCNVFYRKEALLAVGGFDRRIEYWEDVDLGWRVHRDGWEAVFAPNALVYHQVIPLSPVKWLSWPLHFKYMPAKVARYPEYRRYLFLGLWAHWMHALFDLAMISILLSILIHPTFLFLSLPYLVAFPFQRGLKGRWPPIKAVLHLAWDAISFIVLVISSLRHRALVL